MASALILFEIEIEIIENSLRRQRVFRDRLNPMDAYSLCIAITLRKRLYVIIFCSSHSSTFF